MKIKDIAKIEISENHPYSVDEKWSTIDAEGFCEYDRTDTASKLSMMREKLNEVIDRVNEIYKFKTDWEKGKGKLGSK